MDGHPREAEQPALSLIIPAYNEEAAIGRAIAEADDALVQLTDRYEVLVIDDGSHDRTAQVVADATLRRNKVRLLRHESNRGYGAALRTGFEAAQFDRIAFTDADCQFDLADLAHLIPLAEQHDIVTGYRANRQDSWRRRFYSRGYNWLVRVLLGTKVRDCDCALKVYRKEALANLLPESRGFFVNAEMLAKARQRAYRVTEVDVRHRPRLEGCSKVSIWDIPRVFGTLLPFWWSRVLFPGKPHHPDQRETVPGPAWGLCTLILVALTLFFARLRSPLLEPDEARYAEIPRQMLEEGRLLVPILHGQPYYHKPPLLYWLVMASYRTFGVHDWAARLIPCMAGFFTILATYWWARRTSGSRAAFAGAMILCLSARFVYFGRMLTMDSLLCLWVVLAWACAHAAINQARLRWPWWLISALACGLGLLTKGPVAFVLVAIPVLAFQTIDPRTARPRLLSWLIYTAVGLAVAVPWYGGVVLTDARFASEFFWTHNLLRYLAPLDHDEPFWFYLPGLLFGMLPWTLLLPAFVKSFGRRSRASAGRRTASMGMYLIAFLWCLLFYSIAGCKRPGYILPAMAPLALALGCHLDAKLATSMFAHSKTFRPRNSQRLAFRASLLVLITGVFGGLAAVSAQITKPLPGLTLAVVAVFALAFVLQRGPRKQLALSWAQCGLVTFGVLFAAIQLVLPGYARKFSLRAQVTPQLDIWHGRDMPVVCYPHRWDSVSFYLHRDDVRAYAPQIRDQMMADMRGLPGTLVFVKSDQYLNDFLCSLPANLEFVQRGRTGLVTAGIVTRRAQAPANLLAVRGDILQPND